MKVYMQYYFIKWYVVENEFWKNRAKHRQNYYLYNSVTSIRMNGQAHSFSGTEHY